MTDSLSSSSVVGWREQAALRCEAATPGPWIEDGCEVYGAIAGERAVWNRRVVAATGEFEWLGEMQGNDDAEFCANARTDLPRALAELDAVEQERDALKARIAAALNIDSAAFLAAYEGQSMTAYRIGYNACFDAFRAALSVAVPEEGTD